MANSSSISVVTCGDVGPNRDPEIPYWQDIKKTLDSADIRFAQCERVYSDLGAKQLHSHNPENHRCATSMAKLFEECAFDVVSFAGNTAMDWGGDALLDTLDRFHAMGIQTVGAGATLEDARRPAIVEYNGLKIGFLAYCSIVRDGYAATPKGPGIAPLRAHTAYEYRGAQPGSPPSTTLTTPYANDLQDLCDDLDALREQVDAVVCSFHWGISFVPRAVVDYQKVIAQTAVKHGADMIVGHHPHLPHGVEVIENKACFYSVGHLMMDFESTTQLPEEKITLIPRLSIGSDGVVETSFYIAAIDDHYRPRALTPQEDGFSKSLEYMEWTSAEFGHYFTVEGDRVIVS